MLHQIGAGALGPVFRAYEPDRDRLVAVKLFRLDLPPERAHKLVAEFEQLIAADLEHPVIAAARATGIDGVNAYLAQDYVAADSLDVVVRENGRASAAETLRVAGGLADALDYAAARQIVHGALHPRDVLLSTDELRLVGLGVTRSLERAGAIAPVRRPYTAPERIGGGAWDRRADVFSLAAVVHELIWGRRVAATGAQAADGLTETAGGDLKALRDVFACALADDMADRFATATEFANALAGAFDVAPIQVPPPVARTPPSVARRGAAPRLVVEPRLPLDGDDVATGHHPLSTGHGEEPELTLHAPEPPRYQSVEIEESRVEPLEPLEPLEPQEPREPLKLDEPRAHVEPTFAGSFLSPPEQAAPSGLSLVWPLALAAVVGSALGFGAGYATAIHDRPGAGAAQPPARAFTEASADDSRLSGDVNDPSVPTPAARTLPPTPAPSSAMRAAAPAASPAAKPAAVVAPRVAPLSAPLFAGRVLVRSTPPGARVFVDGRTGGETPTTVRDLPRGPHQVRLVREGYTTIERRIMITASKPSLTVTVPMVKVQVAPARLDSPLAIESKPAGATVFLDGRQVGTTPMTLPGVRVGAHTVRIELDGYRHWSSSIQVAATEQNRVTASLER